MLIEAFIGFYKYKTLPERVKLTSDLHTVCFLPSCFDWTFIRLLYSSDMDSSDMSGPCSLLPDLRGKNFHSLLLCDVN